MLNMCNAASLTRQWCPSVNDADTLGRQVHHHTIDLRGLSNTQDNLIKQRMSQQTRYGDAVLGKHFTNGNLTMENGAVLSLRFTAVGLLSTTVFFLVAW